MTKNTGLINKIKVILITFILITCSSNTIFAYSHDYLISPPPSNILVFNGEYRDNYSSHGGDSYYFRTTFSKNNSINKFYALDKNPLDFYSLDLRVSKTNINYDDTSNNGEGPMTYALFGLHGDETNLSGYCLELYNSAENYDTCIFSKFNNINMNSVNSIDDMHLIQLNKYGTNGSASSEIITYYNNKINISIWGTRGSYPSESIYTINDSSYTGQTYYGFLAFKNGCEFYSRNPYNADIYYDAKINSNIFPLNKTYSGTGWGHGNGYEFAREPLNAAYKYEAKIDMKDNNSVREWTSHTNDVAKVGLLFNTDYYPVTEIRYGAPVTYNRIKGYSLVFDEHNNLQLIQFDAGDGSVQGPYSSAAGSMTTGKGGAWSSSSFGFSEYGYSQVLATVNNVASTQKYIYNMSVEYYNQHVKVYVDNNLVIDMNLPDKIGTCIGTVCEVSGGDTDYGTQSVYLTNFKYTPYSYTSLINAPYSLIGDNTSVSFKALFNLFMGQYIKVYNSKDSSVLYTVNGANFGSYNNMPLTLSNIPTGLNTYKVGIYDSSNNLLYTTDLFNVNKIPILTNAKTSLQTSNAKSSMILDSKQIYIEDNAANRTLLDYLNKNSAGIYVVDDKENPLYKVIMTK